jgi:flavodoxin
MRGIIYYFTGTGNNYILAKDLAAQIPGVGIRPMRLLPGDRKKLAACDLIGFCVPSYYSHVPAAVKQYLEGASFTPEQTIFTIIGCGSSRGVSNEEIRERIEAGGGHVKNEYLVACPGNYILSYGAFPKIYERTVIRLSKKKIRKIAKEIMSPDIQNHLGKALLYSEKQEPAIQKILTTFPDRAADVAPLSARSKTSVS